MTRDSGSWDPNLEKRRLREDVINVYKYLKEEGKEDGPKLLPTVSGPESMGTH